MSRSAAGTTAGTTSGTTALQFQAPPALPDVDVDGDEAPVLPNRPRGARPGRGAGGAGPSDLRMLKAARAAATGMKISDDQIRGVLEDPEDVQPDPQQPHRTRLFGRGITVTTGNDGMILRVTRRR